MHIEEIHVCLSAHLYGVSLCKFLISHLPDLLSANISSCCSLLTFKKKKKVQLQLSTLTLLQPLALLPLTLRKTSPNTCPPSPAVKPTGGPGMAAWGLSTCPNPPTSSQSTLLGATCPRAAWATSSPLHPGALGACLIPLLHGEVVYSLPFLFNFHETQTSLVVPKT